MRPDLFVYAALSTSVSGLDLSLTNAGLFRENLCCPRGRPTTQHFKWTNRMVYETRRTPSSQPQRPSANPAPYPPGRTRCSSAVQPGTLPLSQALYGLAALTSSGHTRASAFPPRCLESALCLSYMGVRSPGHGGTLLPEAGAQWKTIDYPSHRGPHHVRVLTLGLAPLVCEPLRPIRHPLRRCDSWVR